MLELAVKSLFALLLIGGALWATRRYAATSATGPLAVRSRVGLTRTAAVAVVEVDGERFLVGATDQQVNVLARLPAAPAADDTPADVDSDAPAQPWGQFADVLARTLRPEARR